MHEMRIFARADYTSKKQMSKMQSRHTRKKEPFNKRHRITQNIHGDIRDTATAKSKRTRQMLKMRQTIRHRRPRSVAETWTDTPEA